MRGVGEHVHDAHLLQLHAALADQDGGVTGDGRMVISAGAFDDKFSGVKLREIDAVMTFDEKGVSLDRFSATDGKAGRITGAGRLDGQDDGKLNLKLSNVVLADRPDAHAAGDGDLALEWRKGGATLSGEIRLNQADMRMRGQKLGLSLQPLRQ